ncbi:MAG: conserved hypothetical cytosolic protein [Bacillales bacterium]|nr:conserved hypothetical cytosolic protein [Bacillales bacterium]
MKEIILSKLNEIERENNIKIILAVESGSRAWGFPSTDSDYDVRFIYTRPYDWYLSIDKKRDVLENPINDLLDISGWDIQKALRLFAKSNPALLEWLQSPIIYKENFTLPNVLRELSGEFMVKKGCIYHYLHMADGNYRDYLQGETVKIKKYFYVLRPLMACMWVEKYSTVPPVEFQELLKLDGLNKNLLNQIDKLLIRKMVGEEMSLEKSIPVINEFIEEKLEYYKNYVKTIEEKNIVDFSKLNNIFLSTLREVWGKQNEL